MTPSDRAQLIDVAVRAALPVVQDQYLRGRAVCDALLDGDVDDETLILAVEECAEASDALSARCAALWLRLSEDERAEAHGHLCDALGREA